MRLPGYFTGNKSDNKEVAALNKNCSSNKHITTGHEKKIPP